jgi:hypothetical protein
MKKAAFFDLYDSPITHSDKTAFFAGVLLENRIKPVCRMIEFISYYGGDGRL